MPRQLTPEQLEQLSRDLAEYKQIVSDPRHDKARRVLLRNMFAMIEPVIAYKVGRTCAKRGIQAADRDDILQEALMLIFESKFLNTVNLFRMRRLTPKLSFFNFMVMQAVKQYFRRLGRVPVRADIEPDQTPDDPESREWEALEVAFERLPSALDREIVVMRYDGFTLLEIGQILGLTPHGLRERINRIRQALAGEEGFFKDLLGPDQPQ